MSFFIAGTGSALPERIVTNDDLSAIMETSDEWITTRTGIRRRRVVTHESMTDLAVLAARRAMADAHLDAKDVDLVLTATMRGDTVTPSQACLVAEALGIHAPAFDLNAACTGLLYCMVMAEGYMAVKKAKSVLIVTAEILSKQIDWTERSSCVLFGDGAGAVVLRAGQGLLSSHITCVPNSKMIREPSYEAHSPFNTRVAEEPLLRMEGGEVYKFAVITMVAEMEEALREANLTIDQIDYVLPHQANKRIIEAAKKRFNLPDEKVLINMADYGNMSATSITVLMDEAAAAHTFKRGDKLLLVAFGAGMTAGAVVITWQKD